MASAEAFVEAVLPGDVSPGAVQAALYVQGLRYHSASEEPEKFRQCGDDGDRDIPAPTFKIGGLCF